MMGLADLVSDWGGFEELIKDLHATGGEISVNRNLWLPAKEGDGYKIDVVMRSKQGMYEFLTIIECKWWKDRVGKDQISHLKHVRDQVGANKAVCFTSVGFQSGAETVAKAHDIGLYVVRDMTDEEWGKPGKVVQLYLQFFQAAMRPRFPNAALVVMSTEAATLDSTMNIEMDPSTVSLSKLDGTPAGTLLDSLRKVCRDAYQKAVKKGWLWNNGEAGNFYVEVQFDEVRFDSPRLLMLGGRPARVESMACDVLFQVRQEPLTIDRRQNFDFALVVEDFISRDRFAAGKRRATGAVELDRMAPANAPTSSEDPVANGSIIAMLLTDFREYDELKRLAADTMNNTSPGSP